MKQVITDIYTFDELSNEAKEIAISNNSEINVQFDWYKYIFDDAEKIGLKIEYFDIEKNMCIGEFNTYPEIVAKNIVKFHGIETNTYQIAKSFLNGSLKESFIKSLLDWYFYILVSQYNLLTSDKEIMYTLQANELEFYKDGSTYYQR